MSESIQSIIFSFQVSGLFRKSLAASLLLASALFLPFVGLVGYEMLSSHNPVKLLKETSAFHQFKLVACVIFHSTLSAAIFSMLGSVVERWITIAKLDPTNYLEKTGNLINNDSPGKRRKKSKDASVVTSNNKSHRKAWSIIYLIFLWLSSIAFGLVSIFYGNVKFFLYGEIIQGNAGSSSLVQIPNQTMIVMSVIYIIFVFVPLLLLILLSLVTFCYFLKTKSDAKKIDSYDEAKFRSTSCNSGHDDVPLNQKLLQLTTSNSHLEPREEPRRSSTRSDQRKSQTSRLTDTDRNSVSLAEYSHKLEHERQVTLNCQETDMSGIMTDSIQASNDQAQEGNHESSAPPPPEWLKFSSLTRVRYSDNSPIQVVDLASSSLSVSIDSARFYFGEASETRATLIAYAFLTLCLLPLCAVLALDIFAGSNSIFKSSSAANDVADVLDIYVTGVSSSLAISSVALFIFGGSLLFFIFYATSELFNQGAKQMCCSKKDKAPQDFFLRQNSLATTSGFLTSHKEIQRRSSQRSKTISVSENQNGTDVHRNQWTAKRSKHQDIDGWRPEERPTSDAIHENHLDIDKRFALDEDDD